MSSDKFRRQIAFDAARLMYHRQESEYYRAKLKAAARLSRGRIKPQDLPSNREVREQIQLFARTFEGEGRTENLREMRVEALRYMRLLRRFRPRLIGSTLTGHVRKGSDIDVHVFSDSLEGVTGTLDSEGVAYDVERKTIRKHGEERNFTHVHVEDRFPIELTIYPAKKAHYVFKSSITGKAIERASVRELEDLLSVDYPNMCLENALIEAENRLDRFQVYESLLLPLENVKQGRKYHPEGDALYHSLQVFDLAQDELPYDEEFLSAALLHDVGKAIDPRDHTAAGLEALEETITPRTAWFIAHHMDAGALKDGTLGARARRRLAANDDYDNLLLLADCDRQGRKPGVAASELHEALDYLRELSDSCGE